MMCLNLLMIAAINFSKLNIIQRLRSLLSQEKSDCGGTQWCALRKTTLYWCGGQTLISAPGRKWLVDLCDLGGISLS